MSAPEIASLLASATDALLDDPARRHALGQVKLLQAPPEVVRLAVPLLLRLLEDPAADVRRMALALVEDAGRSCPSTIPELLPALLTRLSDESAPTLKRALAAATSLLRPTLVLLLTAKDEAAAKALEPTWGHLRELRETAGTLLNAASAADSVRTAAVKACEALVLAYTDEPEDEGTESAERPPGADVASGGSGWRLSALPAAAALGDGNGADRGVHVGESGTSGGESSGEGGNEGGGETGSEGATAITASEESKHGKRPTHPLLERAALEAEGEATLALLETTLLAPPSATVLLVLLTSIAALARQRRVLLQRLSRTLAALSRGLLERAASLAALPSHQVANAQQSLRAALLSLLKTTRAREDRDVEEELATALRHLGATEQLKHLYKLLGTEPPLLPGGSERGAAESAISAAADGSGGGTKRSTADGTEGGDSALAAGPKRVKTEGAPTVALATTTSSGGSTAASAHQGAPPRPPLLPPAELEALLSRLGPHLVAQLVITSMPWLPPRPPPPPPPPGAGAAGAAGGTVVERKPVELRAHLKMDAAACASLAEAALASLIADDREAQLTARGLAEVRAVLLGRLAAKQRADGPYCHALAAHVLAAPKERLPVALAWLHAEFAEHGSGAAAVGGAQGGAAKTGDTATPCRYDVLAMSLLPRLRRALPPNARAAVQVLLEVPKLMSEWLPQLIELEGEEMWRPGLAAYRELATQRDALGPACLRALLQVATSAGESERRAHAVKILTAQLLPLPRFASFIGGFAEAQLRRLVGASTAAHPTASCVGDGMDVSSDGEMAEDLWAIKSHQEGEENEDILTAHVQLYLAVVAKEPARLWSLLAHFGGASAGAQAVLVRNAPLLVPHIDPFELASLLVRAMREIRPFEPSAPLILALLTAVAAGSPPAPPAPPAALVEGTLELCCTELRDGRYAVPLLPFAPRPLVESVLPRLLGMAPETASAALAALMHAKPPPLPPAHLLLLLHQLPSDGSAGVNLKQLIDGVQACLAEKSVFTMQVVADALQLIVHLDPLPLIFMRTTIQALLYHPLLAQFTMGLLRHLISRQIWTSPRLWTGFVKCCQQGMPHSLPVILALPALQLLEIIEQQPELRPMLISYGAMHLSEVADDVKEALGLTEEEEVLEI